VVIWFEMLNEHDGQAGIGGQTGEQKLEHFQPARGGPNAGHGDDCPGRTVVFGRFRGESAPSVCFGFRPNTDGHSLLVHNGLRQPPGVAK
jgi:hypothetical protein